LDLPENNTNSNWNVDKCLQSFFTHMLCNVMACIIWLSVPPIVFFNRDLYSAYQALPGGSRRWKQSVTRVTRQTGKLNERSHTTTSRSQQQIRTES
jgi:hypothetical protein